MKESVKLIYDIGRLTSRQFYDYLVNNPDLNFGFWVPIISLLLVILIAVIYYYIIDRPKTGKLKVWVIFLLATGLVCGVFAFMFANNSLVNYNAQFNLTSDLYIFSLLNTVYSLIGFFVISLMIKWKSSNSSHVPF
jgi:hypothetical protein